MSTQNVYFFGLVIGFLVMIVYSLMDPLGVIEYVFVYLINFVLILTGARLADISARKGN